MDKCSSLPIYRNNILIVDCMTMSNPFGTFSDYKFKIITKIFFYTFPTNFIIEKIFKNEIEKYLNRMYVYILIHIAEVLLIPTRGINPRVLFQWDLHQSYVCYMYIVYTQYYCVYKQFESFFGKIVYRHVMFIRVYSWSCVRFSKRHVVDNIATTFNVCIL